MKRLLINLWISRVLCCILCVINLIVPMYPESKVNVSIFQFLLIGFWIYGLLSHLGYFKKQVSFDTDEELITYETSIPIIQVGLLRIVQFGYYYIAHVDYNLKVFVVFVIADIIYTVFLLLDKAGYVYESEI